MEPGRYDADPPRASDQANPQSLASKAAKRNDTLKKRARIVLVDDHPIVRHGLAQVIAHEADMEVCGEASDAHEALALVAAAAPDLVIVDLHLREGNGLDLVKDLVARYGTIKTLVSSMQDEGLYAERALRAGARGYIDKAASGEQFTAAIRQVLSGGIYLSPPMSHRLLQRVTNKADDGTRPSIDFLSDRELAVFEMIGNGLSTRQMAVQFHLSIKTIESYREHIKAKLRLKGAAEVVHRAVCWVMENNQRGGQSST